MLFFCFPAGDSRVWGRHSPTRFPQGQNERKANFGTAVESCSEKSPCFRFTAFVNKANRKVCSAHLSPLQRWKGGVLANTTKNFLFFYLYPTTIRRCTLPKILKMDAKKQQIFSDLLLVYRCDGRRVIQLSRSRRNFSRLSISLWTICSCISVLICPSILEQARIYPA